MTAVAYLNANRPAWRTEPIADLVAWTRLIVTVPDPTRVDMVALMARLSVADARTVIATLRAAAASDALVDEALRQLRTTGIDVSHPNTQGMIDALFADLTLREKIKALGLRSASNWSQIGRDDIEGDGGRALVLAAWRLQ